MEDVINGILISVGAAALIGFYGSAFVKQQVFVDLFGPVCKTLAAIIVATFVFNIGLGIGAQSFLNALPDGCACASGVTVKAAIAHLTRPAFYIIGTCFVMIFAALACIGHAEKALADERRANRKND